MRGGEEEEKVMSPIFSRLYVNETEKGGIRGPPRNKMALYEQSSIPICSATMLPLANNNSSSLVPSTSWSDVGAHQRSILTPYCNSLVPSHLSEKIQSYSSIGTKLYTTMTDYERVSSKLNSQSLSSTGPSSSSANCDSFKPNTISNLKKFPSKKFGNEDEFRSPISSQATTLHCRNSLRSKGKDKLHHLSYTLQLKGDCIEKMNGSSTIELKSRKYLGNHDEQSQEACQTNEDPVEKSISLTLARVREFENISSIPSNRVEHFESLKRKHASMSQESRSSPVTDLNKLRGPNAHFNMEYLLLHDREALKDDSFVESRIGSVEEVSSKGRMESYKRSFLGDENKFLNGIEKNSERSGENCGVVRVGTLNRREALSDMTMVESSPALDIFPDDVIGVLGEKRFYKMRKAIVNQQRVFAVQLFELHRLIKVQRLMAGSPDLLLEGRPLMKNPVVKISAVKKAPLERSQEPSPSIVKPKDHAQKPYSNTECAEESTVGKFPLPFVNNYTSSSGLVMQKSNYGQYLRKTSPASEATDSKSAPLCFQPPPGNLWLVPVMLPSEGLTYKPYTGPCPPIGDFMAPIHGSCGPIQSLDPGNMNYLNAAYGVPLSYQQGMGIGTPPLLQTYFPPYAPPIINHSSHENPLSSGEINFTLPHQSSCTMSSQMREVMSRYMGNIRASVVSELQGSTPSSPSDRTKGDVLPLFPTAPQVEEPAQNVQMREHQTRAIKVIPRSFRSATESAARIFLSIQEERK
ncbi:protein HEADING DATE 3B-like isoform X1 [Rosa rugosa]|uniref:protein HEADING DATE 3B-like isoform X1 n=2 Tax=Rosa rugosa TaxID=74645 RepID=UPI002B41761D|nr:protein HEADING DATE 3B-like isoform X1 [Rosa rugosa]XP_062002118.1 protein HEADING DATE 3B-like isoform X1 [Rosa rugosa]XP_062002126.1 protein HEADING DATE 3B-like isoform X1 [Rosa rugosa]XP_062002136.1 protein HEADING DATE 3B-like isoform X1 [Rosa rugosa]